MCNINAGFIKFISLCSYIKAQCGDSPQNLALYLLKLIQGRIVSKHLVSISPSLSSLLKDLKTHVSVFNSGQGVLDCEVTASNQTCTIKS